MDNLLVILFLFTIFLFGITIGSFLNVCIYRLPLKEDIVKERSHCMSCGHTLAWYDLIPLFSYLGLKGKCRYCKTKLSIQYPVIEALNGVMYVIVVLAYGVSVESLLYCLLTSCLIALSVIDFRTFEIPVGFNIFIACLGIIRIVTDLSNWLTYLIGAISVSVVLMIIYYVSNGRAIGGGDVKLMAAAGSLLGWKMIILAFCLGCIFGAIIHVARMKISGEDRVLAMGPYLSAGIMIAALWGDKLINWYFGLLM